jgi:hypothetical protein
MARQDPEVIRVLKKFREALDAKEAGLMAEMARRWLDIEKQLDADIALLAREMAERTAGGQLASEQLIWKMDQYKKLKIQLEEQIRLYNIFALEQIRKAQLAFGLLGIDAANAALMAILGPFGPGWSRLNIEAILSILGFAKDGTPLHRLLAKDFPLAVDGILKALINGIARGLNPAQIARDMANGMGLGLERALLIARTEAARAFREGSANQYRKSKVVRGFKRLVHKSTACAACLFLDGEFYELDEEMSDHPRGKCIEVPCVQGVADPKWQTGEQWFRTLPPERQREILGPQRFDKWKEGKIDLKDMAKKDHDPVWGDQPRLARLGEL